MRPLLCSIAELDDGSELTEATPAAMLAAAVAARPPDTLPPYWSKWPNAIAAYRLLTKAFRAGRAATAAATPGEGKGIVTAGGGVRLFPSLYILLKRLRAVGCQLPIEVWHLGPGELDPAMKRLLEPLNITTVDAWEVHKEHPCRILNGWELKPYAILHSRFAEVLFLDADNFPVYDPAELFFWPEYKQAGVVLWPDFPHWSFKPEQGPYFDLEFKEPPSRDDLAHFGKPIPAEIDVPLESGQMLFDKERHRAALELALFHCEFSDYSFRHAGGDHHALHIAYRQLGKDYALPRIYPSWDTHTIIQHDFRGQPLFLHRTQNKFAIDGSCRPGGDLPNQDWCLEQLRELRKTWCGVPWCNDAPSEHERGHMDAMVLNPWRYLHMGQEPRELVLLSGGRVGAGHSANEMHWGLFYEPGDKPVLGLSSANGLVSLLRPHAEHPEQWVGSQLYTGAGMKLIPSSW